MVCSVCRFGDASRLAQMSRRHFLGVAAAAGVAPSMAGAASANVRPLASARPLPTDRSWCVRNASIFTADDSQSFYLPGVLIVRDGVISYVGSVEDAPAVPDDAKVIDASGRILIPGLVSPHFHELCGVRDPNEIDDNSLKPQPTARGGGAALVFFTNQLADNFSTLSKSMTDEERAHSPSGICSGICAAARLCLAILDPPTGRTRLRTARWRWACATSSLTSRMMQKSIRRQAGRRFCRPRMRSLRPPRRSFLVSPNMNLA